MKQIKKHQIDYHVSEPNRPDQNEMVSCHDFKNVPKRLWDYGIKWVCQIMQRTLNSVFGLEERTPLEEVTGETSDISEYLDFQFFDRV